MSPRRKPPGDASDATRAGARPPGHRPPRGNGRSPLLIALAVVLLGLCALAVTTVAFVATGRPVPEPLQPALTLPMSLPPLLFDEVPAPGGVYSEAGVGRFRWLNPLLAVDGSPDADVVALAFAGLTRRLSNGEIAPDLAADWETSADSLSYVFRLRSGAAWQDGAPVTADDAVFTYALLRDPAFPGPDQLARYWRDVEVDAPDASHVRFRLREPRIGFLEQVGLGLLPAHLLKNVAVADLPTNMFSAHPIGSGPFRVSEATAERVTLDASPTYHGKKPLLARVDLRLYADEATSLSAFQRGEVTALSGLRSPLTADLAERAQTHRAVVGSRPTVLVLNPAQPALAEPAVRGAIALGVDRARVGEAGLPGRATTASGVLAPGVWARGTALAGGNQPDLARELLESAGWRVTGSDGVRTRDGRRLEFVLLTNDSPEHLRAATEISRQLLQLGMRAEVQTAGYTGVFQDFLAPRRFQAALVTLDLPTVEPDAFALFHSSQAKEGLNFGGWSSAEVDQLLTQLRAEPTAAGRIPLWAELDRWIGETTPLVSIYYPTLTVATDHGVRGVDLGLALRSSDRFATISEWYTQTRRVPRGR